MIPPQYFYPSYLNLEVIKKAQPKVLLAAVLFFVLFNLRRKT